MMLEEFDFRIEQMRYVIAAIEEIAEFRPNHLQPAEVAAMLAGALEVRDNDFMLCQRELNAARDIFELQAQAAHQAATGVYAHMRNRYSSDQNALSSIERIALENRGNDSTPLCMREMSSLWSKLPVPPGSPLGAMTYVPWKGMNRAVFDSLRCAVEDARSPLPRLEQQLQSARERLQIQKTLLTRFIDAALQQGRARFAPGCPQRSWIDAIPAAPPLHLPGKSEITLAGITPLRSAVLRLEAAHATSFTLRHRLQGDFLFTIFARSLINKIFTTGSLPSGEHEFELIGHNALGDGDAGRPVRFQV